jgi:hypothetical protein
MYPLRFAADARMGRTDSTDDQIWEIALGKGDEPALAVQTRYGGRVAIARLVPMWIVGNRAIYQANTIASAVQITSYAPNYAAFEFNLTPELSITFALLVENSHTLILRSTVKNGGSQSADVRFEMFAQTIRNDRPLDMNVLTLADGREVLHLGKAGGLNPVLFMENATVREPGGHVSPKLTIPISVPAGGSVSTRVVHVARPELQDSLQRADATFGVNWDASVTKIQALQQSAPQFKTGNTDLDAALHASVHTLLRSLIHTDLPHLTFVPARTPIRGFGAGAWSQQTAALGYLVLPALASIAPDAAKNAIRNLIAVQQPDGWIDHKANQKSDVRTGSSSTPQSNRLLAMPLLATIAWRVYQATEDSAFLADVFPGLSKFYERWFQNDMDRDSDGLPEWTNTTQSGYINNPTFARLWRWAQNADISKAEAPDMAAYLIHEGRSLMKMAEVLSGAYQRPSALAQPPNESQYTAITASIQAHVNRLLDVIELMWNDAAGSYLYRDRDLDRTPTGGQLFRGKGDQALDTTTTLDPANRLILRAVGGLDHAPKFSATIEGVNADGQHVSETIAGAAFNWYMGMGSAVSEQVYSKINYVRFEGLSRVYSVEIDTTDFTRQNVTLLLPIWSGLTTKERNAQILTAITDTARYWREYGLPTCPADDPAYTSSGGGAHGFFNALILEGLVHAGYIKEAAELFDKMIAARVKSLKAANAFYEQYHPDTGDGIGEVDDLHGIIPLNTFLYLIGVRSIGTKKVCAGGVYAVNVPSVTITQNGIEITRTANGTTVRFPSGHVAEVGADYQIITDPTPEPEPEPAPEPTPVAETPAPDPVITTDPNPESTPVQPELEPTSEPVSVIPVTVKRDETMEIQIDHVDAPDEPPDQPPPASDTPGTFKIPVRTE